jgi:hypothetical protein
MPPVSSRAARHTFATAGLPRPGAFAPTGPARRLTARSANDLVIRTNVAPRARSRNAAAAQFFGSLQRTGLSFITAYHEFSLGVLDGLEGSLKSTWQLLTKDLWQVRTYTELATTLLALNMMDPLNLPGGMASAQAFDRRWGTHVAQRQVELMAAIAQLVQDVPRWTPRQWGRAVGRLVGEIVLAKGAGGVAKGAAQLAARESVQLSTISAQLQTLGKVSAGTSKLAKARAILPIYARFTLVRGAVPFLNVSTKANTSSFWSGLEPLKAGTSAAEHAQALARANGRVTLEMTKGGAWLDRQTALIDGRLNWEQQLRPQWGRLSGRYAAKARGTVEMYRGPRYAGPRSVWEQYERSHLETSRQAGRVTDIRIIDVPKK